MVFPLNALKGLLDVAARPLEKVDTCLSVSDVVNEITVFNQEFSFYM